MLEELFESKLFMSYLLILQLLF